MVGESAVKGRFQSKAQYSVILRVFKKMLMLLINLVIPKQPMIRF